MDSVPWNRVILEEFISLAILTPEEEKMADLKEQLAHLAKDFIEDPDAKPMKVEKYFLD